MPRTVGCYANPCQPVSCVDLQSNFSCNPCEGVYGVGMSTTADQLTARGWTADDSTFGARLALIRQHMAWGNVKEAATACGIPAESWRTWERDGVTPRRLVEIAGIIADRTGCDFGWLVAGPRLRGGERVQAIARTLPGTDRTDHRAAQQATRQPAVRASRRRRHDRGTPDSPPTAHRSIEGKLNRPRASNTDSGFVGNHHRRSNAS